MPLSLRPARILILFALSFAVVSATWAQQHFTSCLSSNVNDAVVVIPTDANVTLGTAGDSLSTGDEIAVYSDDGECAGMAIWDGAKSAVSFAVADRDSTAGLLTGYVTGEPLKFRVWLQSSDEEAEASVSYTCSLPTCRSDGKYEPGATYEVTDLDASSSLPVELTTFEATRSNQSVVLEWRTASESNNSGFEVQHKNVSTDTWSTLSFVEGAGTTTRPQQYSYEYEKVDYGTHQFRLVQVDRDGSQTISKSVELAYTLDRAYEISEVYPNPIRQNGSLDVTVKEAQHVTVRLYDILGRAQGVLLDRKLPADRTETVQIDGRRLPSGQYFVRVQGNSFQATRKMTLVK
jgi:hypothetical protein